MTSPKYTQVDQQKAEELTTAAGQVLKHLEKHRAELKKLLPSDLALNFSLCYWTDACYYCTQDGRNWYLVKCIV